MAYIPVAAAPNWLFFLVSLSLQSTYTVVMPGSAAAATVAGSGGRPSCHSVSVWTFFFFLPQKLGNMDTWK